MAVINELGGEKIDVIAWEEKPEKFIANALAPAKIVDVKVEEKNTAIVFVPADQLSLAIGKDGRNVRLAANLTGWKIDIKTADVTSEELEAKEAEEIEGEEVPKKKAKKTTTKKTKKEKVVSDEESGTDGEPEEEEKIDETTADEEPEPIPAQEEDDDDAAKDDK